ncbi:MAG: RIP metalloprotease RseP [Smithellaceae bacterium]|nr:RIP metalloprotease RseP [Smithellaceae bacterium]
MLEISIISVIILLGVLIFAHELGHFLAAKASGVGVERFQLGFGPKLLGKKWGETEYRLALIPLGGLVKLLGESEGEEVSEENQRRSFSRQSVYKRIAIVAAGPLFNFLLALLIFSSIYLVGIPTLTTEVGEVQTGSAAAEAGVRKGDVVLALNGREITRWEQLAEIISGSKGSPILMKLNRGGQKLEVTVTPRLQKAKDIFGEEVDAYRVGVGPSPRLITDRRGPIAALWTGVKHTWEISKLTLLSVVKIFEGVVSPKTLGGPILIAQIAGASMKEGLMPFFLFMALLSVNLAILNLLPIPILDGGHLFFFLIEVVIGREVSLKWREIAQQFGFVLIVMLMIFVFMMDIDRLNIPFIKDFVKFFTGK